MKHAILAAEECGKTDRVGAKLFKVKQSAVCRRYNRYNETKAIYQEPTQGRPRKTTGDKLQQNLRQHRRFLISPRITENRCLESFSYGRYQPGAIVSSANDSTLSSKIVLHFAATMVP